MKAALRQGTTPGQQHLSGFQNRVADALSKCGSLDVLIESDSAVAIFADVGRAILSGEQVFQTIFDAPGPIWMRGVIVGCGGTTTISALMNRRTRGGIPIRGPGSALLEALVAEKSGFKGFRLRVKTSLLTPAIRNSLQKKVVTEDPYDAVPAPTSTIFRTKDLRYAGSPNGSGFEDVLWMLDDEPEFNTRDEELTYRLRRSGRDPAEAEQAAMTKVVFEEARAIAGIVRR